MDLNWDVIGKAVAGAIPIVAAIVGFFRGPGVLRSRLNHDVDLLQRLPPGSPPHDHLLEKIDRQLRTIESIDREASRDVSSAVIAFLLIVGLTFASVWLWAIQVWWGYLLAIGIAIFALAGIASMIDSLELVPRDEKGRKRSSANTP